jgi:Fe(3+) dicitrate transport protein
MFVMLFSLPAGLFRKLGLTKVVYIVKHTALFDSWASSGGARAGSDKGYRKDTRSEVQMSKMTASKLVGSVTLGMIAAGLPLVGAEPSHVLAPVTVLGRQLDAGLLPGSVAVVTAEELLEIQPRSTEDVLRRVPGIYVKGEEENAVVVNVGVRGLPAGDYKTLVLEDGVPVQPGIFVGNSRYYNPRVQRMSGVEVLKGASSLRYGPNTIGGVINYLSKTPADGVSVSGRVGSWNTYASTIELGGRLPEDGPRFGVIATHAISDGFMDKE